MPQGQLAQRDHKDKGHKDKGHQVAPSINHATHKAAARMEVSTLLHRRHDAYSSVCIFLHPFLPHIETLRLPLGVSVLYSKGRMGT